MADQSTLKFNSIMIGTSQPIVVAEFYQKVFARPADMHDGTFYAWNVGSSSIAIMEHSEVKGQSKEPARIMLNLETNTVKEEFERVQKLGVTVIKEPYEMGGGWIATLADPDGNYVQLVTPFEM